MLAGVNDSTVKMKSPLLKKSNISFTKPAGNPAFSICLIPLGFFSVLRHCHWSLYIVSHHLREAERKSEHEEVYAFTPASAKHWKAAQLFRCTQAEEFIFTFSLLCINPMETSSKLQTWAWTHTKQAKGWNLRNQCKPAGSEKYQEPEVWARQLCTAWKGSYHQPGQGCCWQFSAVKVAVKSWISLKSGSLNSEMS